MLKTEYSITLIFSLIHVGHTIPPGENGKDLPNNFHLEQYQSRIKIPTGSGAASGSGCKFGKKPVKIYKTDGNGKTFLDIQYINVGYNYEYNINCGTVGGSESQYPSQDDNAITYGGGHKPHRPIFGGHHKPGFGNHHKPGIGNHHKPLGGNHQGTASEDTDLDETHNTNRPNRPFLSNFFGNRPFQNIFGQSHQSSEAQQPGVFNNIVNSFTSILPSPQDFGQGLGDGISSFILTIPQIGQSFQSLLPNFGNFFGGAPSVQNIPNPPSPVDPGDMTYNDEIKPVHEEHDPVTDPYKNRLRPGQYLVASHPLFGSATFDLSPINPIKLYQQFTDEVADYFGDFFKFRRYN
ncbi:uncharacterized protein LOC126879925 isoform X2 [Diabrotica virgifera virgifera]|uniref:Uncharacterized protein n=1 Tax=Diabrotica virgifera virgifera TaxID=50390 RepID=A0ABM5JMR5_DIAVI|nr:uncharacterized protein LOC126879925 isoform X2 [Diabrotica virgifera virgifera]